MSFDPNANPESIAARAAELSLEQMDRFRHALKKNTKGEKATDEEIGATANKFYAEPFEIIISNKITSLMSAYAVLKGYVSLERAGFPFPE